MHKKLTRSQNKMIAGVCGGFAEYLDWDPTIVRLGCVIAALVTAVVPGIIFYIIASFVMPKPDAA